MGPYGWGKNHSVIEWLFAEGYRFDFFQAVRLLEILNAPELSSQDEGVGQEVAEAMSSVLASVQRNMHHAPSANRQDKDSSQPQDFLRFKSAVALNFPTSDISKVKLLPANKTRLRPTNDTNEVRFPDSIREHEREPTDGPTVEQILERVAQGDKPLAEMTVNLMGLAGALGPLDMPTTELIIERQSKHDTALKDFLDIFNHRLISLLYKIRKTHHIGLEATTPGRDQISKYLLSIIGLGTGGLLGRMQVRDRSLLHYAGLLGQESRSLVGLELILADYFKLKVKGRQFTGQWYELDESSWTIIGESGQNQTLGQDAVVVGTHVWDAQAKIELQLGPLTLKQFEYFLPTGWGFSSLCDLTTFYLGETIEFSFRLTLAAAEVPQATLKLTQGPSLGHAVLGSARLSSPSASTRQTRLGWTSWLKRTEEDTLLDAEVEVHPGSARFEFKSERVPLIFNLPPAQLNELLTSKMQAGSYEKDTFIMRQGEPGDSMFAIRSGTVKLIRRGEDGKTTAMDILSAGECFGEMTLLVGKHRDATAIALEDCKILELHKKEFDEFGARYPRWKKALTAYQYGQLVKQQETRKEFLL